MHMFRKAAAIGMAFPLLAGCAARALVTPTPARQLSRAQLAGVQAPAGERYFLLVFGSESRPRLAKHAHSWATLVTTADDAAGRPGVVEVQTISWLPRTLDIHPARLSIEPGRNFTLSETLAWLAPRAHQVTTVFGPFEARPALAVRFRMQKGFLDSGAVGYQAVDTLGEAARTGCGCNCFHALSDADPDFDRRQYPLWQVGETISGNIARQTAVRGGLIEPCRRHDWLLPALGLDRYRLRQESLDPARLEREARKLDALPQR